MRRKTMKLLMCAGLCAVVTAGTAIVGYANTSAKAAADTTANMEDMEAGRQTPPEDDGSVMAKISAVSSSSLTVYLSERPEGGTGTGKASMARMDGETLANGETRPERPERESHADGETPPARPEGETPAEGETPPEKPDGDDATGSGLGGRNGDMGGGKGGMMNFADEATTYTVTSSTIVTGGMGQESASLSDLESGTVVRLTLDGDTVVSIDIMTAPSTTQS